MSKVKLTAGRIEKFKCDDRKNQSFLWCAEVPGLGVRATAGSDEKRYIFQAKVRGRTMRVTIGKVSAWSIPKAQEEARRLQVLIDQGNDPREVKAQNIAEKVAGEKEKKKREKLESITLGMAWYEYVMERKKFWSNLHYKDHVKAVHQGGDKRTRSKKLTVPGTLASLVYLRLVDLTPERIEQWAQSESTQRQTQARLGLRLLRAFLFWCERHPIYKDVVKTNAAKNKKAKEFLGKPKLKNDVLQREQLHDWFKEVLKISNKVISAYLQALLLTGARREELASLRWSNVDFKWNSMTINDKVEGTRVIPQTPYVNQLLISLPQVNEWVFSSKTSASGRLADPRIAHNRVCSAADLELTLHGLRRSFATLSEWTEMPAGIAAQIQGHKPQGVREQNYIRRPLDLLRKWHVKFEEWILKEAKIEFCPEKNGLRVVA